MQLRLIDDGMSLTINEATSEKVHGKQYRARFDRLIDDSTFMVDGIELFERFDSFGHDTYLKITFFIKNKVYSFNGKPERATLRGGKYLMEIRQISPIESYDRRISPRYEMEVPVTLYVPLEHNMDGHSLSPNDYRMLFSGETFDLSAEGTCILSNEKISQGQASAYYLEIFLNNDRFFLRSDLVRNVECSRLLQFRYDYGFLFDFTDRPDEKKRLVVSIFKYRSRGF